MSSEQRHLAPSKGVESVVEPDLRDASRQLYLALRITLIVGLCLSTACLIIRLLTRQRISKFTAEDLCLTTAWGFCVGTQIVILYALDRAGLGVHIEYLAPNIISTYEKLFLAAACLFIIGICLARVTHLILFHRLMVAKRWLRCTLYVVAGFITAGSLILTCCFIFACQPISKSWNVLLAGKCINRPAILIAVAVLNIISDICLILLPIPVIHDLQVPRSQKIRSVFILVLVCITFVASAIRLKFTVPLLRSTDLTYCIAPVALLVGVEANLVIIAATLPALRQCLNLLVSSINPKGLELRKRVSHMCARTLNVEERSFWQAPDIMVDPTPPLPVAMLIQRSLTPTR